MSSSSALNYKIQTQPSLFAKHLVMIFFIISAILLALLWGINWFSSIVLISYISASMYFVCCLQILPFQCLLSECGNIEIYKPDSVMGDISSRSFYNKWILFLCIEITDPLLISSQQEQNKPRKWFVLFHDSVQDQEYRLLARLVNSARWT